MAARLLMGVVVVGLLAVHTQACTLPSAKIAPRVFAHYLPWFTNQCETLDARPRDGWCGPGDCSDVGNFQYRGQPAIGEYSQLCAGVLRYHVLTAAAAGLDGFVVNVNPRSDLQVEIASRLADAVDALAAEAVAGGSLCGGADAAALGCWRFQLVVSYDNSAAASLADVVSDFTLLRDSLYNRPGIDADAVWYRAEEHGGGAGARGFASAPVPLFTWSEAGESHFAHALSTVFGGTTPVVRVARNARAFDGSAANFQWIGTMSTAADVATNWGEQYLTDFEWIMARQVDFGASNATVANQVVAGAVWPGFNDTFVPSYWNGGNTRVIARTVDAGSTMNITWRRQLASDAASPTGLANPACDYAVYMPWVQVVTWNDWPEGTSIEPAAAAPSYYGTDPLLVTQAYASAFKLPADGSTPTTAAHDAVHVPLLAYMAGLVMDMRCGTAGTCGACDSHTRGLALAATGATVTTPASAGECEAWAALQANVTAGMVSRDSPGAADSVRALLHALAPVSVRFDVAAGEVLPCARSGSLAFTTDRFTSIVVRGGVSRLDTVRVTVTTLEAGRSAGTITLPAGPPAGAAAGVTTAAAAAVEFTVDNVAAANAALDGLVYTPHPTNGAGLVTLTVAVGDAASASVDILVHAPLPASTRDTLMAGVTGIDSGSSPGYVVVWGSTATAVVDFQSGGTTIAASTFGRGHAVLMGDHQMLSSATVGATGVFVNNALQWATGYAAGSGALQGLRIVVDSDNTAAMLASLGFTNVATADSPNDIGAAVAAGGVDAVLGELRGASAATIATMRAFCAAGGVLVVPDYGVGYDWWWGGIDQSAANDLLRPAGMAVTTRWPTSHTGVMAVGDDVVVSTLETVSVDLLVDRLQPGVTLTDAQATATTGTLTAVFQTLPATHSAVRLATAAFHARIGSILPTPANGVSDAFEMGLIEAEAEILADTPSSEVVKHRTADDVYGRLGSAQRVVQAYTVTTLYSRWQTTGLYVPAGEDVTVAVPADSIGKGLVVQVSGHRDSICGKRSTYHRVCSSPARRFALDAETVTFRTAFGGALYIDVGVDRLTEPVTLVVSGAAEAPLFVLGETTNEQWQAELLKPAPYAELFSEHVAFSVNKTSVQDVVDMQAVLAYWDRVVQHQDELGGYDLLRTYPYRVNIDVQVSVGYLHAGYPTQGPQGTADEAMDLATIVDSGDWGWYHELGHESQKRPDGAWDYAMPFGFHGATEVTVNLFSAYAYDKMGPPSRGGWSWTSSYQGAIDTAAAAGMDYIGGGAGDRLSFYLLVRFGYGWDGTYKALIREYNDVYADPAQTLPSSDQEKVDEYFRRMSRLTGYSMRQYMLAWGLTLSSDDANAAADASLPSWMPLYTSCASDVFATSPGGTVEVDLGGHASVPGCDVQVTPAAPEAGLLRHSHGHVWVYSAPPSFLGAVAVNYTVQACGDNADTCTAVIRVAPTVAVTFPSGAAIVGPAGTATYSTAGLNAVVVATPTSAARTARLRFTVRVEPTAAGTVSLGSTADLAFVDGDGAADTTLTVAATVDAMTRALDGLTFTAADGYAGRPRVYVTVADEDAVQVGPSSLLIVVSAELDAAAATAVLTEGLTTLHSGVDPGHQIPYGPTAMNVLNYAGVTPPSAFVVAATWGSGRVVSVPDHQAMNAGYANGYSATFMRNAVAWAAGGNTAADAVADLSALRVVAVEADLVAWAATSYDAHQVSTTASELEAGLHDADVFVAGWLDTSLAEESVEAIAQFVARGGGLLIAEYGLGWDWWWGGIENCLGNVILREAGVGFTDRWYREFGGNPEADVMTVGTDLTIADAASQPLSYADVLEVYDRVKAGESVPSSDVDAADTARSRMLQVLQPSDFMHRRLAATACSDGAAYDAATGGCVTTCPNGTFTGTASGTAVCLSCHPTCGACTGAGDGNCSACATTGEYTQLDAGRCLPCEHDQWSQGGACLACHASCAACTGGAATDCTACDAHAVLTEAGTCETKCAADPRPQVPSLFLYDDGQGRPRIVTTDCSVGSPYVDRCNDPATPRVAAGGITYYVVRDYDPSSNGLIAACSSAQ